ncbi:MAG: 5-formyltetrahydrofolate cyclo-ligase [Lactobacillaceae bacterium]|jgi:5-formyltetrahydrofolate cyclo-ligase|nr:5-formyltetrahydrofolate cyclo-ligase [Lactobacillaceae bacterium]
MNKSELRKIQKEKLSRIKNKAEQEEKILAQLFLDNWFIDAKTVATTMSTAIEFDTAKIRQSQKRILLPRIVGTKMEFIEIHPETEFDTSAFGIQEPIGEVFKGEPDLVIVPGLAFNLLGDRLGFGKGYYDSCLKDNKVPTISLVLNEQLVDDIPVDDHDITINKIYTTNATSF